MSLRKTFKEFCAGPKGFMERRRERAAQEAAFEELRKGVFNEIGNGNPYNLEAATARMVANSYDEERTLQAVQRMQETIEFRGGETDETSLLYGAIRGALVNPAVPGSGLPKVMAYAQNGLIDMVRNSALSVMFEEDLPETCDVLRRLQHESLGRFATGEVKEHLSDTMGTLAGRIANEAKVGGATGIAYVRHGSDETGQPKGKFVGAYIDIALIAERRHELLLGLLATTYGWPEVQKPVLDHTLPLIDLADGQGGNPELAAEMGARTRRWLSHGGKDLGIPGVTIAP